MKILLFLLSAGNIDVNIQCHHMYELCIMHDYADNETTQKTITLGGIQATEDFCVSSIKTHII